MLKYLRSSAIVFDESLFPRDIDELHVASLVNALKAGAVFPPLILDSKSNRLVDGRHRLLAYQKSIIDEVYCELVEYQNDVEMAVDAVRRNVTHGKPLSQHDRMRAAARLDRYGATREMIARALCMPMDRLRAMLDGRLVTVIQARRPDEPARTPVEAVLKPALKHLARKGTINQRQFALNDRLAGSSQVKMFDDIIGIIETTSLDEESASVMERFDKLMTLCDSIRERRNSQREAGSLSK